MQFLSYCMHVAGFSPPSPAPDISYEDSNDVWNWLGTPSLSLVVWTIHPIKSTKISAVLSTPSEISCESCIMVRASVPLFIWHKKWDSLLFKGSGGGSLKLFIRVSSSFLNFLLSFIYCCHSGAPLKLCLLLTLRLLFENTVFDPTSRRWPGFLHFPLFKLLPKWNQASSHSQIRWACVALERYPVFV